MDTYMKGIGNQLNRILTDRKINKTDFAKEIGLTPRQLNNILSNESLTTLEVFDKICKLLDIPSDVLLQEFDNRFILFTINDYAAKISAKQAEHIINNISVIFNSGENNE